MEPNRIYSIHLQGDRGPEVYRKEFLHTRDEVASMLRARWAMGWFEKAVLVKHGQAWLELDATPAVIHWERP